MAWIESIPPEEAKDALAELYGTIREARGDIADVHRVQSLNPRAMRAHLELYKSVVFARSPLPRITRERIAVVVSAANACGYCVAHHGEALRQLGESGGVIEALARGELPEDLPGPERALLRWASQGARDPAGCGEAGVAELRRAGYPDRAILDAALTVGYFAFVNRLVLLLGVEVEPDYERTCTTEADPVE